MRGDDWFNRIFPAEALPDFQWPGAAGFAFTQVDKSSSSEQQHSQAAGGQGRIIRRTLDRFLLFVLQLGQHADFLDGYRGCGRRFR